MATAGRPVRPNGSFSSLPPKANSWQQKFKIMKRFSPVRFALAVLSFVAGTLQGLAQQGSLDRRFSADNFRRSLRVDTDAPMFASEADAASYFGYRGEWKLEISTGFTFDSNAFQDSSGLGDSYWGYGASLAYEWWTSKDTGIVITPGIGFDGRHYDRYGDELNGDQLFAGVEIALTELPLSPTFGYNVGWGYSSWYSDHQQTEHVLDLAIGNECKLGEVEFAWKLGGGHAFVDPDEGSAIQADFGLESVTPLGENLDLLLNAGTGYRDYTEDSALGRDTWIIEAGAALNWTFHKKEDQGEQAAALVLGTTYYHASDSQPFLDADQFTTYVALKFTWEGFRFFGLPRAKE
jgi:hypothetical protein